MRADTDFDALFPGVARAINVMATDLIKHEGHPTGVGLAMIIAGSELLTAVAGTDAATGALAGAIRHIELNKSALDAERERLIAAA